MDRDYPPAGGLMMRSRVVNVFIIALILAAVPVGLYYGVTALVGQPPQLGQTVLPQIPPSDAAEMVEVRYANPEIALSEGGYSGAVRLVIAGFGQSNGSAYSDAFYTYTDTSGLSLAEPRPGEYNLLVNGQNVAAIRRPTYSPFHIYELRLTLPEPPAPLAFLILSDDERSDNTGSLQVFIIPED